MLKYSAQNGTGIQTWGRDGCNQVSHETIYRSLFVQTRGVLKKELLSHLRSKRSMRRSKPADPNGDRRGHIKDIVSIRQRPAAVEDRAVPGHWEGDLLSGPNNSYIATLVERHTRYVVLGQGGRYARIDRRPAVGLDVAGKYEFLFGIAARELGERDRRDRLRSAPLHELLLIAG